MLKNIKFSVVHSLYHHDFLFVSIFSKRDYLQSDKLHFCKQMGIAFYKIL